jgi:fluoroquinolone transport system permease protein
MKMLCVLQALGPIDAKSVSRDPLLRWMVFYPLLLAGLIRWGVPWLTVRLLMQFQFDLTPYYSLLMSFVLLMTPMLTGMVIGFLLLDQRDDQTLTALQVTPLTLNGYLVYRISLPIILSLMITLIIFPLAGLVEIGFGPLFLAALSAAPLAPFYALSLAAFAANKVQGFALTKTLGVLLVPPLLAYFVPPPWQWVFGLVPLYWPVKLFWMLYTNEPGYLFYLVIGLLYQFLLLLVLLRRFNKVMHL